MPRSRRAPDAVRVAGRAGTLLRARRLVLRSCAGLFLVGAAALALSGAVFDDGGVGASGDALDAAIAAAPETDEGPARYRFSSPDVLWWGCLAVAAACSATLYARA